VDQIGVQQIQVGGQRHYEKPLHRHTSVIIQPISTKFGTLAVTDAYSEKTIKISIS